MRAARVFPAGLPAVHPASKGRGLRALIPDEPIPAAIQGALDRVLSALLAEDGRARSELPEPPSGWFWDATIEETPTGSGPIGEVRVRLVYRLREAKS